MAQNKSLILVADDEPSTLAMVAAHLRARGYQVLEAADGDEAWELAHEHLPHVVVLDVMMPGMGGWEVCKKIREAVSLAHTGVVMLTGIGETLNEMTSPLYGADAYIDKPFEFSELDRRIEDTLARRRKGVMGRGDSSSLHSSHDDEDVLSSAPLSERPGLAKVTGRRARAARPKVEARATPRAPAKGKAASKRANSKAAVKAPAPAKGKAKPELGAKPKAPAGSKVVAAPAKGKAKPKAPAKLEAAAKRKLGAKPKAPAGSKVVAAPAKGKAKPKAAAKPKAKGKAQQVARPAKASPKRAPARKAKRGKR